MTAQDLHGNPVNNPEHVWEEETLVTPWKPSFRDIAQSVLRNDPRWLTEEGP